eukprot:scaffold12017_cov120-Isochrysis_galbana.AAC.5
MPCTVMRPPQRWIGWRGRKMMSRASQLVSADTTALRGGLSRGVSKGERAGRTGGWGWVSWGGARLWLLACFWLGGGSFICVLVGRRVVYLCVGWAAGRLFVCWLGGGSFICWLAGRVGERDGSVMLAVVGWRAGGKLPAPHRKKKRQRVAAGGAAPKRGHGEDGHVPLRPSRPQRELQQPKRAPHQRARVSYKRELRPAHLDHGVDGHLPVVGQHLQHH